MGIRGLCSDDRGFSTTFDVFLFLVFVSISGVILLPAITGNTQITSVLESKSQKQSSQILLTLLNGRVDEFEYIVAGDQMDALAGTLKGNSVYEAGKKMFAGKELKHKTFADLTAENAAAQWVVYHNGKRTQLNFLMTNYTDSLNRTLKNYLDKQIGDRYNYNLTVVWRPVVNVPIGGDVTIGEPVPNNAYSESTYITMPYHVDFTRKHVEDIFEDKFNETIFSKFVSLKTGEVDRNATEKEISSLIFNFINETIDDAVAESVDLTLAPVLDKAQNTMIEQFNNLLPSGKGGVNLSKNITDMVNKTLESEGTIITGKVSEAVTSYLQDVAKQQTHEILNDEISALTSDLADLYVSNGNFNEVKDRILTEVFSRINISRAQVTLSIWEKRR